MHTSKIYKMLFLKKLFFFWGGAFHGHKLQLPIQSISITTKVCEFYLCLGWGVLDTILCDRSWVNFRRGGLLLELEFLPSIKLKSPWYTGTGRYLWNIETSIILIKIGPDLIERNLFLIFTPCFVQWKIWDSYKNMCSW